MEICKRHGVKDAAPDLPAFLSAAVEAHITPMLHRIWALSGQRSDANRSAPIFLFLVAIECQIRVPVISYFRQSAARFLGNSIIVHADMLYVMSKCIIPQLHRIVIAQQQAYGGHQSIYIADITRTFLPSRWLLNVRLHLPGLVCFVKPIANSMRRVANGRVYCHAA